MNLNSALLPSEVPDTALLPSEVPDTALLLQIRPCVRGIQQSAVSVEVYC